MENERTVIKTSGLDGIPSCEMNLLPCRFEADTKCKNFENFFKSSISVENDHLSASFRGRPLLGKQLELPEGYVGLVLEKKENDESDDFLKFSKKFDKFTYWNLDSTPGGNDKIVKALQWLNVSKAIHEDI